MKQFIIISLIVLYSSSSVFAQEELKKDKISELEGKIEQLEEKLAKRDSLYESHLTLILEERQKFVDFIEHSVNIMQYTLGAASVILGIIFAFFGFNQKKHLKKYADEAQKEARRKLKEARDKIVLEISSIIKKDPAIIKSVIDDRVKDAELKKKVSIRLFEFSKDNPKLRNIKLQLIKFGIENIHEELINPEEIITKLTNTKEDIAFLIDFDGKNQAMDLLNKKLDFSKKDRPCFFYAGKGRFPSEKVKFSNYCNSEITIYQNLMDLIRFMDFKGLIKE